MRVEFGGSVCEAASDVTGYGAPQVTFVTRVRAHFSLIALLSCVIFHVQRAAVTCKRDEHSFFGKVTQYGCPSDVKSTLLICGMLTAVRRGCTWKGGRAALLSCSRPSQ